MPFMLINSEPACFSRRGTEAIWDCLGVESRGTAVSKRGSREDSSTQAQYAGVCSCHSHSTERIHSRASRDTASHVTKTLGEWTPAPRHGPHECKMILSSALSGRHLFLSYFALESGSAVKRSLGD